MILTNCCKLIQSKMLSKYDALILYTRVKHKINIQYNFLLFLVVNKQYKLPNEILVHIQKLLS